MTPARASPAAIMWWPASTLPTAPWTGSTSNPKERAEVLFLIGSHLELSAALRRDIFNPETVAAFADKVGTPERLKMLCLLTYADIKAVNPEALTPWKAENVWQLYMGAENYLNRSADQRVHADVNDEKLARLRSLAPVTSSKFKGFLEGFPQRYLLVHSAEEVMRHMAMADELGTDPVQVELKRGRHWYELTLVTSDRPFLFAKLAGRAGGLGHEHREGQRVLEPGRNGGRHALLHRSLPDAGAESFGVGSVPPQRHRACCWARPTSTRCCATASAPRRARSRK